MPRIVHIEIPSEDPDKAAKFYKEVFDWETTKWDGPMPYWLVKTGPDDERGIDGAFMDSANNNRLTYVLDVDDVDTYVAKVQQHGGTVVMPKDAVPGVGYLAYFEDLDGNLFGIMQRDESAGT
ncbi:VOC family protein [Aggregatilinea lenta]|uniref:VOC family protein n=1 Tax=Aggregatilinea lenta TaxID=913108 RepID=UPI000E5B2AB5|nr:VOC family protein [Aggregatilinea lenta]